jgi:hypothetical protein
MAHLDHIARGAGPSHRDVLMLILTTILHTSGGLVAASGTAYAGTIVFTALAGIAARDPRRRRDARETLEILLRRNSPRARSRRH